MLEEERRQQAQSARERRHLAASIPATTANFQSAHGSAGPGSARRVPPVYTEAQTMSSSRPMMLTDVSTAVEEFSLFWRSRNSDSLAPLSRMILIMLLMLLMVIMMTTIEVKTMTRKAMVAIMMMTRIFVMMMMKMRVTVMIQVIMIMTMMNEK